MNETNELKIHDIKDIFEIPDYSIFMFYSLIFLGLLVLLLIILFIIRYFKNKKPNKRKEYFQILKDIDYSQSKSSAYTISRYIRLLAKNERENILADELIELLQEYKYKKDVKQIDDNIKAKLSIFMDVVDV
jgi:hypothetical protein